MGLEDLPSIKHCGGLVMSYIDLLGGVCSSQIGEMKNIAMSGTAFSTAAVALENPFIFPSIPFLREQVISA